MAMQSVVYTYSGILFSLKNNGAHCYTWMSLEKTVLSEISQSQKVKHCVTPLIRGAQSNQVTETESPRALARDGGGGTGRYCAIGTEFEFSRTKRSMCTDGGGGFPTV